MTAPMLFCLAAVVVFLIAVLTTACVSMIRRVRARRVLLAVRAESAALLADPDLSPLVSPLATSHGIVAMARVPA